MPLKDECYWPIQKAIYIDGKYIDARLLLVCPSIYSVSHYFDHLVILYARTIQLLIKLG